jgi:4-diphosphocytidyl-2C-methyl-D-erythritol kinase
LRIAAQVGSDVPLFLIGGAVLGLDRGQSVFPLPDLESTSWCVVAIPALASPRRRLFATGTRFAPLRFDRRGK